MAGPFLPDGFRYEEQLVSRDEEARLLEQITAHLLSGPARTEWEHSIPAVDKLRYSVTYRSLRE